MTRKLDVLVKRRLEDGDFDADSVAPGLAALWRAADGAQREEFLDLIGADDRDALAGTLEDWDVDVEEVPVDDDDEDEDDLEDDEVEDDLEEEDDLEDDEVEEDLNEIEH